MREVGPRPAFFRRRTRRCAKRSSRTSIQSTRSAERSTRESLPKATRSEGPPVARSVSSRSFRRPAHAGCRRGRSGARTPRSCGDRSIEGRPVRARRRDFHQLIQSVTSGEFVRVSHARWKLATTSSSVAESSSVHSASRSSGRGSTRRRHCRRSARRTRPVRRRSCGAACPVVTSSNSRPDVDRGPRRRAGTFLNNVAR